MMVCRSTKCDKGAEKRWLTYDSSYWRLRYARMMRLRQVAFVEMGFPLSKKLPIFH